jgi:penicillin-insensitive murein endopeptidase
MRGLRFILNAGIAACLAFGLITLAGGAISAVYGGSNLEGKPGPEPQAAASPDSAQGRPAEPAAQPSSAALPPQMTLAPSTALPPEAPPEEKPNPRNVQAPASGAFKAVVAKPGSPKLRGVAGAAAGAALMPAPNLAKPPAIKKPPSPPARDLFGAAKEPANMATRSIGFYAKGCLAGAQPLPVDGPAWQAMRLSRNRMWGHPLLVAYIERFAKDAKEKDGWPGLLVGDMSMPRGGPMPFGHASHQVGLDVDIWYRPMPDRQLSQEEREKIPMESFLLDPAHVNPKMWSPDFAKLLRRAVSYPEVTRVFVNPAIKKWLCDNVKEDRAFLRKITPIMGHDDHFHVRLACPADNPGCQNQPALPVDEGCGKGLDKWVTDLAKPKVPAGPPPAAPKPAVAQPKSNGRTPLTMAQLPPECAAVLKAPSLTPVSAQ